MDWLKRARILLIDDNASTRTIVAGVLDGVGAPAPHQVADGARGLEALRDQRFDLAIVDFLMRDLDGVGFTRRVRNDPDSPAPELPIVMMTSYADRTRVTQARDAGVNELLVKPITIGGLVSRIEAALLRPRPFVRTADYYGPDRRRRADPSYSGPERRTPERAASPVFLEEPPTGAAAFLD